MFVERSVNATESGAVPESGVPEKFATGATGGGVWKTTNGGGSWTSLFDKQAVSSIGAIAVAESDANVVYVGTGETCIRGNLSHGDGVYKSTDAGKSWANVGLKDSRQIADVVVHPRNPDLVYVAALGHVYGPNAERGASSASPLSRRRRSCSAAAMASLNFARSPASQPVGLSSGRASASAESSSGETSQYNS